MLVVAGVVTVILAVVAATLVVRALADDDLVGQSLPGPVLVVPGYGGDTSDLVPLVVELRSLGRQVVVFTPTAGGTGDLRVQAARLKALVTKVMDQTGAASVDIVGYSAGGVVARLFVRDGGASVVRRVLTLGSPHHGTDVATLAQEAAGGCPTACEQLVLGSDLLRRLNARDETPAGTRWVTVRTTEDRIVTPVGSAALQGALNILVQNQCPQASTSHGELPSDPVVLAALRSAVGSAAPRAPRDVTC